MANNIFLTGVTGVLGGRLLIEILASTQSDVYCLVRSENETQAKERIKAIAEVYDPAKTFSSHINSRVKVVLGDITKPYLGIKLGVYRQLIDKIDLVIHCAANVGFLASYRAVKPVNVEGTARVVKFCQAGSIPLAYVSTFTVLGEKIYEEGFVFKETDLDVNQSFKDMNYQRSKFEAEQMIHKAGEQGLRWVILRSGNILGDSVGGYYPLKNTKVLGVFYEIFRSVVETGLTPFLSVENFDITPADYVARGVLNLALNPSAFYHTFHLVNPAHTTFNKIMNLLVEYGYRVRFLDLEEFVDLYKTHRVSRSGKLYRSSFTNMMTVFTDEDLNLFEKARFDTSLTQKFLENTGIKCQEPDMKLFATYLDYCVKVGHLPAPADQKLLAQILPLKTERRVYAN